MMDSGTNSSALRNVSGHQDDKLPPFVMSRALFWVYVVVLPLFNGEAIVSNALILCLFCSRKLKKYRCSVYFRFLALVDIVYGVVIFGIMWWALVLPDLTTNLETRATFCRTYTIYRYTVQDLSAWGLVCLVLERCHTCSSGNNRASCCVITVFKRQCVIRHMGSKALLLTLTIVTLVVNYCMVMPSTTDFNLSTVAECFNTWKSPQDFNLQSLAVAHCHLNVTVPCLSLFIAYLSLRIIALEPTGRTRAMRQQQQQRRNTQQPQQRRRRSPNPPTRSYSGVEGTHSIFSLPRWLSPRSAREASATRNNLPVAPLGGTMQPGPMDLTFPDVIVHSSAGSSPQGDVWTDSDVTMMHPQHVYGASFLDRLYNFVKSRDFMVSIIRVEDKRLVVNKPSAALTKDLNAMACAAAIFFIVIKQPEMYLMMVGNGFGEKMDWNRMRDAGLVMDLIVHNRVNFTILLYKLVTSAHFTSALSRLQDLLFGALCPCAFWNLSSRTSNPPPAPPLPPPPPPTPALPVLLTFPSACVEARAGSTGQVPGYDGEAQARECLCLGKRASVCPPPLRDGGESPRQEGQGEEPPPSYSLMTPC